MGQAGLWADRRGEVSGSYITAHSFQPLPPFALSAFRAAASIAVNRMLNRWTDVRCTHSQTSKV